MEHGRKKKEGSVPSQQLEANAFVTNQDASMKLEAKEEDNGAHNVGQYEHAHNHLLLAMSTSQKVSKNGKKGPSPGTYLVQTVSCPLKALNHQKKELQGPIRVIIPRIIPTKIRYKTRR